jgi:hypothetical protein
MTDLEGSDRKSVAALPELITDPDQRARREASNGLRQVDAVVRYVEEALAGGSPFRLRPSVLLDLNRYALEGSIILREIIDLLRYTFMGANTSRRLGVR